jgi:hypothetical protein
VSSVSEAAEVSEANEEAAVTEQTEAHAPVIRVLKGRPTDEDLAALVTVFAGAAGGGPVDAGPPERDMWGHPVDRLRYAIFSWQRVTQVERVHIRR